jgi:hypothetical protein
MRIYPETASQETLVLATVPMLHDMDTRELILKHLAPGLGCIVAFIMWVCLRHGTCDHLLPACAWGTQSP